MSTSYTSNEVNLKFNITLTNIQSELKCGVCRSTFHNPVAATCSHTFCKDCLNQVFQQRRTIECPLCRKAVNKRSCTSSEQLDSLVKGYLQLGRCFSVDLESQNCSIPKELMYKESQIPSVAGASDSPIRDFRLEPQFALPKARARRRQPINTHSVSKLPKMNFIPEESEFKENAPITNPRLPNTENGEIRALETKPTILPRRSEANLIRQATSSSVEVQCDLPDTKCICRDLRSSLQHFKKSCGVNFSSDLQALFAMAPEYKKILEENACALYKLIPLPKDKPTYLGGDKFSLETVKVKKEQGEECAGELPQSYPTVIARKEVSSDVKVTEEKKNGSSPFSAGSLSDVVLQSPQSSGDELEITLQTNFESFPDLTSKLNGIDVKTSACSSMIISVSRLNNALDESLVHEFLSMFTNVGFHREITSNSTHLIMMNCREQSCERRSLLYVYAVANKCEILSRQWLEECIHSKRLLPTTQYALTCESTHETPGWLRSKSAKIPLFDQMKFFLPRSFSDSQLLPLQKLKDLISICGGSCFEKPWQLVGAQKAFTVFMPRSCDWDAAQRYEASMDGIPVVTADWVLDSIAEFRLMPIDSYRIRQK